MRKIILIFFAAVSVSLSAQNEGIQFLGDSTLQSALAKAKQANKLLFVDCYTSWCGPCKYMAKNIFPLPEVGNFFNQHFLNWKVDCDKINKVDAGIFAKFNIRAWPTYLFLDGDGNIVHMALGSGPASFFFGDRKSSAGFN
jgi:thiol:disulfide interchange protein